MKTRDRRTLKDDILFSDDMAEMFRVMESESVKKFVISIWDMGKRANEAGYKKDTPEEIEQAISEALDDEYSKATADEKNPFYLMYFKAIRGKIESQTVKYYQNSLKNSANAQKADENKEIFNGCTAEQKSEFDKCLDWTVNHSAIKNPTTSQKRVIMEFVKQGGTEAYISSRYLREPEQLKHSFDPISVMKSGIESKSNVLY